MKRNENLREKKRINEKSYKKKNEELEKNFEE